MKVVEFRLFMPTTLEQYKRCQLYMVAKASIEDGTADGLKILVNEEYTDGEVVGQYTLKQISLASKLPNWLIPFLNSKFVLFNELSWNAFPKLKTKYTSDMFPKATIEVESQHHEGVNTQDNALELSEELYSQRRVIPIDIMSDPLLSSDAKIESELQHFRSEKANLGPFGNDWLNATTPIMTCYKLVTVDLPYFGYLSSKIETWIIRNMHEQLLLYHRKAVCWMDEWYDMHMEDIRKLEDEVKAKLDKIWEVSPAVVKEFPDDIDVQMSEEMRDIVRGGSYEAPPCIDPIEFQCTMEERPHGEEMHLPVEATSPSWSTSAVDKSQDEYTVHSGYVYKLGDGLFNSNWNKRYIVLYGNRLWYYNDPRDGRAKELLNLSEAQVTWTGDLRGRTHSVQLTPYGRRPLYLSGESEGDTSVWFDRFKASSMFATQKAVASNISNKLNGGRPRLQSCIEQQQATVVPHTNNTLKKYASSAFDFTSPTIPPSSPPLSTPPQHRLTPELDSLPTIVLPNTSNDAQPYIKELLDSIDGRNYKFFKHHFGLRITRKNSSDELTTSTQHTSTTGDPPPHRTSRLSTLKTIIFIFIFVASIYLLLMNGMKLMYFAMKFIITVIRMCVDVMGIVKMERREAVVLPLMYYCFSTSLSVAVVMWITYSILAVYYQEGGNDFRKSVMSRFQQVTKCSMAIEATASEVNELVMDTSRRGEWYIGHCNSKQVAGPTSDTDYVYHRYTPIVSDSLLGLALMDLGFVAPRELRFERQCRICKDGSYLIVCYPSKEALRRFPLNATSNKSLLSSFLQLCDIDVNKPIEGFEVFLITPTHEDTRCVVTYLSGSCGDGGMMGCCRDAVAAGRSIAVGGLKGCAMIHKNDVTAETTNDLEDKCEDNFIDVREANNTLEPSSSPLLEQLNLPLCKRMEWPVESYTRSKFGGLICTDEAVIQKQKGVMFDFLKSSGKAILEGKGIVGISLPVRIFEPLSLLERVAATWGLGAIYFNLAALSEDPLERMKYAVTFAVSSLHSGCFKLKPFNPILGETFEAKWVDGAAVYMEHTSHHPPISHFHVKGPDDKYQFWGYYEFKGQLKGNTGFTTLDGPNILQFSDGSRIQWNLPVTRLSGLLWGQRVYEWLEKMEFRDEMHNLKCSIKFAYEPRPLVGRPKVLSEAFKGVITSNDEVVCDVGGSWLDGIDFGGIRYWSICDYELLEYSRPEYPFLPSDSRYREDAFYLGLGDERESQDWKVRLEVQQRKDRHNRMEYRKSMGLPDPYCT